MFYSTFVNMLPSITNACRLELFVLTLAETLPSLLFPSKEALFNKPQQTKQLVY